MRKRFLIVLSIILCLLLTGCKSNTTKSQTESFDNYNGKRIGVITGTIHDSIALKNLENPVISYYNSTPDVAIALEKGKIDAYLTEEPVWRMLNREYPGHKVVDCFSDEHYAYAFRKDNAKSERICQQMNEFLRKCNDDDTLKEIDAKWFGTDESLKYIDRKGLTAKNGIINFVTCTDIGAPFSYVKNNEIVGYDIDIAVRFCREYGYGINISNSSFEGMLMSVSTGKSDFCGACITVTPERSENMLFSEANYKGGIVLVAKVDEVQGRITSTDQLAGTRLGIQTGAAYDRVAADRLPQCEIVYYNSNADMSVALEKGKIEAFLADEPVARMLSNEYPSQRILSTLKDEEYAWAIPKVKPGSEQLCREMNEFFAKCRKDGTLEDLDALWFGKDQSKQKTDYSNLTAENGTLIMAVCSTVGPPFCYVRDNQYTGCEVDLAVRFCREYGYGLQIADYDATGLFSCLATGKCDFGGSCIAITEERKETMLFTDSYYKGGIAIVVNDAGTVSENTISDVLNSIKESFYKTFIREDRYKMFLYGLGTTLFIVILALIFGSVIGFAVYIIYYRTGRIFHTAVNVFLQIMENTPVVVILMILYYIIFGSTDISGVIVSVIGFTLIFTGSVIGVMKVGVGAVDRGQREAALALGYTENKTFMKVILPQAAIHFLPGYKSAIVQLIKGTSIVGYIAVIDLTKVSDIIRGRTYEAFFPLIVTAVLYFLMAVVMSSLVKRIEININPETRKSIPLLKGVKTDD